MDKQFITYGEFQLTYKAFGSGKKTLLAFTGFGEDVENLAAALINTGLGNIYTIYAVDLFFHGESKYPEKRIAKNQITKKELGDLFLAFLGQLPSNSIEIFGYSLGGKIALVLLEQIPPKIDKAYLVAPDGLKNIWWYKWVANFPPFLWVYRYYIKHPYWYFWWIKFVGKLGLLHQKSVDFAIDQMKTEQQRKRVHDVWLALKKLNPDPEILGKTENFANKTHVFLGQYDKVIRKKNGLKFCLKAGLNPKDFLTILPHGHQLLKETPLNKISNFIKRQKGQPK